MRNAAGRTIPTAVLLSFFLAFGAHAAAGKRFSIRYSFEEAGGPTVSDSGPLKADGALSAAPTTPVSDVSFTAGEADQWVPLLRNNGAQVKRVKPGSEHLLLDTDAPIVFDRGPDYAMDNEGGRIKAVAGGRMQAGQHVTLSLEYADPGPSRVAGSKGKALQFDGIANYVDCGDPEEMGKVSALTLDLWFQVGEKWNKSAVLASKGDGLSLGFDGGCVVFRHDGLKTAAGKAADATRSAKPADVKPGTWQHLRASWANGAVVVQLDDKEIARTDALAPASLATSGPLRLGGCVDPQFFAGMLDEVQIEFEN